MAPSSRTQPEQHAPPVQWLRVRYAKRGRARFTSHRDFGRAFERALRRAGVPMAYSSGLLAASTNLVPERGAHRGSERSGVPRDRTRRCLRSGQGERCARRRPAARPRCPRRGSGAAWGTGRRADRVPLASGAARALRGRAQRGSRGVPGQRQGAGATDDQDWAAGIRRSYGGDRARRCGCAAER